MASKRILMLVGDFVEDVDPQVPRSAWQQDRAVMRPSGTQGRQGLDCRGSVEAIARSSGPPSPWPGRYDRIGLSDSLGH